MTCKSLKWAECKLVILHVGNQWFEPQVWRSLSSHRVVLIQFWKSIDHNCEDLCTASTFMQGLHSHNHSDFAVSNKPFNLHCLSRLFNILDFHEFYTNFRISLSVFFFKIAWEFAKDNIKILINCEHWLIGEVLLS